jgi:hypothetical protein
MATNSRRSWDARGSRPRVPLPDGHGLPGPRSTRITAEPGRALAAALGRDCGEFAAPYACVAGEVVRVERLGTLSGLLGVRRRRARWCARSGHQRDQCRFVALADDSQYPVALVRLSGENGSGGEFAFIRCDRLGRERQEPGIRIQGGHGMPPSGWGGPANTERNPLAHRKRVSHSVVLRSTLADWQ